MGSPLRNLLAGSRTRVSLLCATVAFLWYSVVGLAHFHRFRSGIDLTIFGQAIKQYAALRAPVVLVKGQAPFNLLGDHFHPILALIAPFYRLWPDVQALLIAQAVLIAGGVLVLTGHAVDRLGPRRGALTGIGFAFSWGVLQAVDFDFHEIAFGVLLLALSLRSACAGRWTAMVVYCALLLLVKEDAPFLVIGIAAYVFLMGRRKLALLLAAGATGYLLLVLFIVIPAFNPSSAYTYFSYVGGSSRGLSGLIGQVADAVATPTLLLLLLAFLITAGLGALSPVMLVLVPTIAVRLASSNGVYLTFGYHYNATLMVVVFFALIDGWSRLALRSAHVQVWATRVQIGAVITIIGLSLARTPALHSVVSGFQECSKCGQAQQALRVIPNHARVAADVFLASHLVDRADVLVANPSFTDSLGASIHAGWVVLDLTTTAEGPPGWPAALERRLLTQGFRVDSTVGSFVVLECRLALCG